MGIFASRKILKNKELTFNYNVDRYGWVSPSSFISYRLMVLLDMKHSRATVANQNAWASLVVRLRRILVAWMTCISKVLLCYHLSDTRLIIMRAALGISDEVDKFALKGNKKKKGRKLDEDYTVSIRPLLTSETSVLTV